ncbi:hypothetical protein CJD36_017055 [Flavipsychrobacter stenotrophus]|uniref:Secretion system C-terminal sorting domain-containing protein n=1 Tax=Flavipsychrobacter stenotrophus TaxID=2077091 RepID=A0A2S7SSC0_9BACT|nr:T9SS type A sorting domain-containing protein [Flavipsychrobacter stenotrophus]PQJ09644.1 hypothetical protein CJD36_017055 [Flavipsychrobacter stenotrophus]
MKHFFTPALGAMIMFSAFSVKAQLINCNVFLKGSHLEVGVNPSGAFGSSESAPAGYHANQTYFGVNPGCAPTSATYPLALGFVADPMLTNWTNYFGDYYMPGTPQEGWAIQIGSNSATAYTPNLGAATSIPGVNIGYNTIGTSVVGTWQGMFDSVQITQVTSIDTNTLYFKVNVTLTNLSIYPKDSIYYMRTIDPDNEQMLTSSFVTDNFVEHQVTGTSNLVVVSATGLTNTNSYMALGTNDARAKCFILDFGLTPSSTLRSIYNGTTTYHYSGRDTADAGIGLVFNIGHLATVDSAGDSVTLARNTTLHPANSQTFSYQYAFKTGILDTLGSGTGTGNVGISAVGSSSNSIKVMPNPVHNTALVSGLNAGDVAYIYDLTGREVLRNDAGVNGVLTVNTEDLSTGIYILVVKDQFGNVASRVKIEKN